MDQTTSNGIENNVFNRQPSNNNEQFIVVSLLTVSEISQINLDVIRSKIENSADLFRLYNDLPEKCEKYIRSISENIKIFLILSNKHTSTLLNNIHHLQILHSVYIYGQLSNRNEMNVYPKVNRLRKVFKGYDQIF
jgi:hypothetical protein